MEELRESKVGEEKVSTERKMPKGKRIRDVIHDYVLLDPLALALVDTPTVQRLRRVRQVGTAYLVYPGANHTRFEHSLGTYHLAKECVRTLGLNPELAIAALLHDVGHGPFSHVSEEVLGPHEKRSLDRVLHSELSDVLLRYDVEPSTIARYIRGEGDYGSLISGTIDVDRMDYLARDAHHTGVSRGMDLSRLIVTLRASDGKIGVTEGGLPALESFLISRFLMYPTVYLHHTCRVGEMMLVRALQVAIRERELSLDELAGMDDVDLIARLRTLGGYPGEIIQRLDRRDLLKVAYRARYSEDLKQIDPKAMEKEMAEDCRIPDSWVIVDVPPAPRMEEVDAPILSDLGTKKAGEVSTLIRALAEAQKDYRRVCVYVPTEYREMAGAAARIYMQPTTLK